MSQILRLTNNCPNQTCICAVNGWLNTSPHTDTCIPKYMGTLKGRHCFPLTGQRKGNSYSLVSGSSPGQPITSHIFHSVMTSRPRDCSPLVYSIMWISGGQPPPGGETQGTIGVTQPMHESGLISGRRVRRMKLLFPVENLTCHPAFLIGVSCGLAYYRLSLKVTRSSEYYSTTHGIG